MSDPTLELGPGLKTWLEGSTEVIAAFGAAPVLVFDDTPPTNQAKPYLYIAGLDPDDDSAECLDATQVALQLDAWTKTRAEARRLLRAAKVRVLAMADDGDSPLFTISGFRVVAVQAVRTQYLTDPSDGKTIHGLLEALLSIDPV
jgi:hypothetical protein